MHARISLFLFLFLFKYHEPTCGNSLTYLCYTIILKSVANQTANAKHDEASGS